MLQILFPQFEAFIVANKSITAQKVSTFGVFCSAFCRIRMRENTDQKNSEYGHFLRSAFHENCNEHGTILGKIT